ncbi:MAG: type I-C CRISPR-associated endonuclease Cas1c [Brevinematales bacterium]
MKRLLNTLFVTTQKVYLKKEGETIVVKDGSKTMLQIPLINLSGIVCFGNIRVSPFLLGYGTRMGISISFLSENGKFLARVQGPVAGNVLLRKAQYRISDYNEAFPGIVQNLVIGKISNCRTVLQRAVRDHAGKIDETRLHSAINKLERSIEKTRNEKDPDILRGIEGEASRKYFSVFNELIVAQKSDFIFKDRSRRPPLDRVNALLSFVYTLLYHDMRSALECTGLDPGVGFLHRDRPGRLSLALDLMEEFRPFFADRLVLSLINLKQVEGEQFKVLDNGAVFMNDAARKTVLMAYQKRKQEAVTHPFVNDTMHIGILFHTQAMLLARHIRGDLDAYPPFLWR